MSCSGFSATSICMVEQLGLAMMPRFLYCAIASGLTSLTTSGTSGSMRNCEVLSITTAPALAARGACTAETLAPGENSAISTPLKSKRSRSSTFSTFFSPKETSPPAERSEAIAWISETGKSRSARMFSISWPTTPVAPTTATLNPMT